jgi:phosphoenolpyruvate-protein phosphotransferase/dihydroxyacetone kinase phosphotransfer subunit
MVGLVLVSHSRALAIAVQELVTSMSGAKLPIAIAAGTGAERSELGTDATEILEGINAVMSEQGVLVLLDIGSAILSAETALELLDESQRAKVRLCGAPFVEGAVAAGVIATLGSSLDEVSREAEKALRRKAEYLDASTEDKSESPPEPAVSDQGLFLTTRVVVRNPHGLHARPAAEFIRLAGRFNCEIVIRNLSNGKGPASAKSMSALAAIEILQGHEIELAARGPDAQRALTELKLRIEAGLGETLEPSTAPRGETSLPGADNATTRPVPVSPGIAIGPLFFVETGDIEIPAQEISDPSKEKEKLRRAIDTAKAELARDEAALRQSLGNEEAEIFHAQALVLEDPELLEASEKAIQHDHQNAALAWQRFYQAAAKAYQDLSDEYLRQRATDVLDIGHRVLEALGIQRRRIPRLPQSAILVTEDLTPADVAGLSSESVLGVICLEGGKTSHAAILLRGRGIPAIAKAKPWFDRAGVRPLSAANTVAFDGQSGELWLDPSPDKLQELQARKESQEQEMARVARLSHEPAITKDGHSVEVLANLGHAAEAAEALKSGAEGVGLFRTEFLFLNRSDIPDEDEQFEALRQLSQVMHQRPVIIRTLDIGGDKMPPALDLPVEANPFLGVRAIRLCLERRELFRTHLRAILRAAHGGNFRIMFPMITDLSELHEARAELEAVHAALENEKKAHAWPIPLGLMIEVPSAGILIEQLARNVDFFSIGTNDLTQYVLAADRGNAGLAQFHDALHPAVLRLISRVTRAAHEQGRHVGVCGEAASDPVAASLFVGLGVDELSLAPAFIPKIKETIRRIKGREMEALAVDAQGLPSAAEVRALMRR